MLLLLICCLTGSVRAQTIDFPTLLDRMTDLKWLACAPELGELSGQLSSYDRASRIVLGTKLNWFANDDSGNFLGTKVIDGRKEYILADIAGPGAVVRIWSANPNGVLRIYVDGGKEPVIVGGFADLTSGRGPFPFVEPLAGVRASGHNLYFPIPFSEHVLVTCEVPGKLYYLVDYIKYPPDTEVVSLERETIQEHRSKITEIAKQLRNPYYVVDASKDKEEVHWHIGPGESQTLELVGPGAITDMEWQVTAEDLTTMLRKTLLEITWDDFDAPSIWSPLGDFFCGSFGLNQYEGLPLGVLADGTLYSHWYMPYASKATVTITNEGQAPIEIQGKVGYEPIAWSDQLLYFHAKWKRSSFNTAVPIDWEVLNTGGRGRFVGLSLSVTNPVYQWWGEGDEKVYVDHEKFPSWFGTGTEDYFGYAWCNAQRFTHAYHNQPRVGTPGNYGWIVNNRFHILDNIPFQEHLKWDLEVLHHVRTQVHYDAVVYWYGSANGDVFDPVPGAKREIFPLPKLDIYMVEGAVEGEVMQVKGMSRGVATPQGMHPWSPPHNWSSTEQMWWRENGVGDYLELAFDWEGTGDYLVYGVFTKARDYGQVKLYLNGRQLGDVFDFYGPDVVPTPSLALGTGRLQHGSNILRIEVVGKNSRSVGYMFGLDYLKFEPVDE